MKKFSLLPLPLLALVLELLPSGAVLIFAPGPEEHLRRTFSYFSLTVFGYANFAPFLTALLTCVLLILTLLQLFRPREKTLQALCVLSAVAFVLSLGPLVLGTDYFTLTGAIISAALAAQFVLSLCLRKRKDAPMPDASAFWFRSWACADAARQETYRHLPDFAPDELTGYLHSRNVQSVCDAGCGCGLVTCRLAANGFHVSGFDLSDRAAALARQLLEDAGLNACVKCASVLSSGYPDGRFDCVLSRSVLDHMTCADCEAALAELLRITRPGGLLLLSFDLPDVEYTDTPHTLLPDGSFLYTAGKWDGMIYHAFTEPVLRALLPANAEMRTRRVDSALWVQITKLS